MKLIAQFTDSSCHTNKQNIQGSLIGEFTVAMKLIAEFADCSCHANKQDIQEIIVVYFPLFHRMVGRGTLNFFPKHSLGKMFTLSVLT